MGKSGKRLRVPSYHIPVTVPEACGSTGENQPSLSDSPLSVPAELGPPTLIRDEPGREGRAGSTSEDLCPRVQHQWGSQSARGKGEATLAWGNAKVLTGPWSCPHPIHGCEPEADNGSDCGPGDSAGSWHLFSGSSACSGPAKDRELIAKGG